MIKFLLYLNKLTYQDIISGDECRRFLDVVQRIDDLEPNDLLQLNVQVDQSKLKCSRRDNRGIF